MRLDHFSLHVGPTSLQLREWNEETTVCRIFPPPWRASFRRAGRRTRRSRRSNARRDSGSVVRSLQIVWDDLRSSRADIWHAPSEEPQATTIQPVRGPATREHLLMLVGPHPTRGVLAHTRLAAAAGAFPGGHRRRVTPVPIPNTEVKPSTADGTACESVWESRSLPGVFSEKARCESVGPFVFSGGAGTRCIMVP